MQAGKRLRVFENITGTEAIVDPTRNLRVKGINRTMQVENLQRMFAAFGDLHVLDTQQLAQKIVVVSYFDIRNAKSAFNCFSSLFNVTFLPDPPFAEYSDILYIFVDSSNACQISECFGQDSMHSLVDGSLYVFKYYDLRTKWNNQLLINTLKSFNYPGKPQFSPALNNEDKENIAPFFTCRKNPENLTQFVINLEFIMQGADLRTTLMVKNIPNKYTQSMLLDSINRNHSMTFDFMYLPIDFKNKCNVGYAFINFVDYRYIPRFYKEFDGKKWEKFNSEKVCALSYARIQGRLNLEKHFQSSSIMVQDKGMRPVMLASFHI